MDYAAATPVGSAAIEAMEPFLTDNFYNPSAVYQPARKVRMALEVARGKVASVLGAKDQEVIFTAGGTEANNIAISGVMERFPEGNIVVSSIEHESVLEPASKYDCRIAPVDKKGIVDIAALKALIDDKTVLVSVMYANNEIGTVQPLKEIASLIEDIRIERTTNEDQRTILPLYLHTDACQAANYLDLQVGRLGVDLLTLNGGKIYAMKQSGCLYVAANVELANYTLGGGQERGIRSGTENVGSFIAFATMLQKVQAERKIESVRLRELKSLLFAKLSQKNQDIILNGNTKKQLPNNLNITLPGADGERLLMELDNAGVLVATGSACTASSDDPSHVLLALGLSAAEANASIRITLGRPTTEIQITNAAQIINEVMARHTRLV